MSNPSAREKLSFPLLPVVALVAVNALWGFSFPVVKALNEMMDLHFGVQEASESTSFRVLASSWMVAVRFSFAFVLIAVLWSQLTRKATRAEWAAGVAIGFFFYLGLMMQVIGLATIPASRSGFLTSLTTVFTPIIATFVFRRLPSTFMMIGAVVAVMGVSALTGMIVLDQKGIHFAEDAHERWTLGDSLTTLGSVFFSFQVLLLDYFGKRMNSTAVTPSMFLTTAFLGWLTVCALLFVPPLRDSIGVANIGLGSFLTLTAKPAFVVGLLLLAFFCSLLSFGWMNQYQPYISATQAAVIYSLEPVFASACALFLPALIAPYTGIAHANEEMTIYLWIGGAMILIANVIALYPSPASKPVASKE